MNIKNKFLFFLIFTLYGEFQDSNTLASRPYYLKIKYFLVDEGIKNICWSIVFGLGAYNVFRPIEESNLFLSYWYNLLRSPLITITAFFPFIYNGIRYFQFLKDKNLIDKIAEEEGSLVARIKKNNFFDKGTSYFTPNKKKLLGRTLFHLNKTQAEKNLVEVVAKLEQKSKKEVFEYYASLFNNHSLEREIIVEEEIERYLDDILLKLKRADEINFSLMIQVIRLFLENKKNIQGNIYKLQFLIQDKRFLHCLENRIEEYQESYPIIFLTKYFKCKTREKAIGLFLILLEIANNNFYLIQTIIDLAKESLYGFLKTNSIEQEFLHHLKNLEEIEIKKIIHLEQSMLQASDQINLYQHSLDIFISSLKIKNDTVKVLQETIKIQLKRNNDNDQNTIAAESKIKFLMNEINNFEKNIALHKELIRNTYDKIQALREQLAYSHLLIKKYKDFFNIVSQIIYYGNSLKK